MSSKKKVDDVLPVEGDDDNNEDKTKKIYSKAKLTSIQSKLSIQEILLVQMMQKYTGNESNVEAAATSFFKVIDDVGLNDKITPKSWKNAWTSLIEEKYIVPSPALSSALASASSTIKQDPRLVMDCMLTEAGISALGKDGCLLPVLPDNPKTNQELQQHIKDKCINKVGVDIFELLLKKGSLSRSELAKRLDTNQNYASFNYAMQQLKALGYVEFDPTKRGRMIKGTGKKLRLTDICFLVPNEDRDIFLVNECEDDKEEEEDEIPMEEKPAKKRRTSDQDNDGNDDQEIDKKSKNGKTKKKKGRNSNKTKEEEATESNEEKKEGQEEEDPKEQDMVA